jgi:predicted dehydrogenase
VAFVNLTFRSGLVALVNVSWLSPVKLRRMLVVGSKKMVLYEDSHPDEKVRIYDHGVFNEPATFGEFQLAYHTGDIVVPHMDSTEPLSVEMRHFLDCVQSGATPLSDGASGLRVVQVLEAAEASLRGGACPVRVEDVIAEDDASRRVVVPMTPRRDEAAGE